MEVNLINCVSTQIKELRTSLGLSQERFAELCGISTCSVQRYEKGQTVPRMKMLKKIQSACEHYDPSALSDEFWWSTFKKVDHVDHVSHIGDSCMDCFHHSYYENKHCCTCLHQGKENYITLLGTLNACSSFVRMI